MGYFGVAFSRSAMVMMSSNDFCQLSQGLVGGTPNSSSSVSASDSAALDDLRWWYATWEASRRQHVRRSGAPFPCAWPSRALQWAPNQRSARSPALKHYASRLEALKNVDSSLGLATIPVQLFTATSSNGVAFHLLHARCGSRIQTRLECPIHGIVPREETVRGYEIAKDDFVRFEPDELKALEQASTSALVIDTFVPEGAIDPVYFEDTYYLGAGKNGQRGYRVLVEALRQTHRMAVGTFTWRGKTTPIAIRLHQDGLLLQRLYFADEVQDASEIDRGAEPKIRDQERTLAERLIGRAGRDRVPPGALRGRVPEARPEGHRTEDRGSGD